MQTRAWRVLRDKLESQRNLTREANDQLAASKEQMATLRKQLEETQRFRDYAEKAKAEAEKAKAEAESARDEAEQHGYDVGVAETEDGLRAEVPTVYRAYCAQTWEKALNRAGIDASSELRRPENIFFPPAIQAPGSLLVKRKQPSNHQVTQGCSASESSHIQSA